MHRPARPRPDRCRQRRGQRLTFTGRHFGDVPLNHGQRAHELHGERPLADRAPCGFARQAQSSLERIAFEAIKLRQLPTFGNFLAEAGCAQGVNLLFHLLNARRRGFEFRQHRPAILEEPDDAIDGDVESAQLRRLNAPGVEDGPEFGGG